jgi:pantoate--beta-alanine ligase
MITTRTISSVAEMSRFASEVRAGGKRLGLVPTMGALHEGHLSLVRRAKSQCDVVVVSIFVNPTQFGPAEDFARYPRRLENDLELLDALGVDAVFSPASGAMYPSGFSTVVDPGCLTTVFEGALRPGHFRGVATVVLKLFNIVRPDQAFFGQKDFQQVVVLRRLVEDLNLAVRIAVGPTVREADGLAMSSRNAYLDEADRQAALVLWRSLERAGEMVRTGEEDAGKVLEEMQRTFAAEPRARLDYAAIVSPSTLEAVTRVIPGTVALVAARVGGVRLIDNHIFAEPGASLESRINSAFKG